MTVAGIRQRVQARQKGSTMSTPRRSRTAERGQILVIVAGGAITLLLIMGLVLDGGVALFNRRDAQNTSDVMAMAGTKYVADTHQNKTRADASTWAALTRSAAANDCVATGPVPCTWQAWYQVKSATGPVDLSAVSSVSVVPANAIGVRVAVRRQPTTFVVGLAGIRSWDVNTQATALAEVPSTAPGGSLLPIALKDDGTAGASYQPGQVVDLTDGKDTPGGFGYISWTGSNDPNALSDSICYPDNPEFNLPHDFVGDPGKSNSTDVRACLDKWISPPGQTILIPIYDTVSGPGNGATYHIVAVAQFVIVSQAQPAVDNIRGYFVGTYNVDPIPGGLGSRPPTPDDTSMFFGLVR
jgi:Flp pilus assembly protein TadG